MLELNDILKKLTELEGLLGGIKLGVAGSYAKGTATEDSDVDVVADYDMLDFDQIDLIKDSFDKDVDVVQLPLLKEEDERLDKLALSLDLPINDESAYKNIVKEVIWCE